MTVQYIAPLRRGWDRTRAILFPFHLQTWVVLGFSAWVAGFGDLSGGQPDGNDLKTTLGRAGDAVEGLIVLSVIAGIAVIGLVFGVILLWLGSRFKFVFLDNVIQSRAQVAAPWGDFGRLGDSLFVWRLVFSLLFLAALMAVCAPFLISAGLFAGAEISDVFAGLSIAAMVVAAIALALPYAFVNLMLNDFVVPIMYRHRIGVTEAWGRFLPLLRAQIGEFLIYALFILLLHFLLGVAIVMVGILTCCVGAVLFALPLIGTVLLLPVWTTYRAFSVEFLGQFGEDFRI